jgi:hypothetical protein
MTSGVGGQPVKPDFTALSVQDSQSLEQALALTGVVKDSIGDIADTIMSKIPLPGSGPAGRPILNPQIKNNPNTKVPVKAQPKPTPDQSFTKSYQANLQSQTAARNLNPDELKNLEFMKNNPGVPLNDPKMQEKLKPILQDIYKAVQADLTSQGVPFEKDPSTGLIKQPASLQKSAQEDTAKVYDEKFEAELAKSGLSEEDTAKARYAHYNPGSKDAASQDPKIQAAVAKAESAAIQSMKNDGYVVPDGWTPPAGSDAFNAGVSVQYSDAMEAAITKMGKDLGMSDKQIESAINNFYNPDSSGQVPSLVAQAQSEVMATLGPQLGVPAGAIPAPATYARDALLNGEFSQAFRETLGAMPLSPQLRAQVLAAISDPAQMTPEAKATIDEAWNKAIGQIQEKYNLPVTWAPTAPLSAAGQNNPMASSLAQADQMINSAIDQANQMPPGVEKQTYLNFLKNVSEAISELKKTISLMEGLDSKMGMHASKVQLEASMQKAVKKQDAMTEINKKLAKQGQMKAIGPAVKAIIIAILWVLAAATMYFFGLGAIFIAIIIVLMVLFTVMAITDEAIKNDPSVSKEAKSAIGALAMVTEILATIVLTIATFGAGTAAMVGMQAVKAASQESIKAVAKAILELVKKAVQQVLQAIKELPGKIVQGLKNAVSGAKDMAAEGGKSIGAQRMGRIQAIGDLMQAGPQVTKSVSDAVSYANQAEIALMKGEMEKFQELMKSLIKLLQKLVSALLGNVSDLGDWLKTVGEMEISRTSGMEKVLNNIRS